jgi:hypothetical protein
MHWDTHVLNLKMRNLKFESIGFRGFTTPDLEAFPLVESAPEGIRTPNLLTYSAVYQRLRESEWIRPYQAFPAWGTIPI